MKQIQNLMTIAVWWDGPRTIEEVYALNPDKKINGNGLYLLCRDYKEGKLIIGCLGTPNHSDYL